ncbi:oligopeptide transporter [Cordyceps fumosorosea ARSEF 2679]|uniref:Oligopeptide transporter n=1 Tax=Cordyceps fumosorosea (strain ARSEF 2679) TaxID=1081104 RepID=A0A168DE91_CORFA|nr:oligopeptide transporter [Cordyceps fumosorosea ARSEF 2679]OAA72501.1 oligopeptide transporter [Cordyceps fumosorosea ARSEF 2679]
MPAGDAVAEPIVGAELRAEAQDERKASLIVAQTTASDANDQVTGEVLDADLPSPTADELATLRRIPDKIPLRLYTIAFIELCERFSYYGSTVVFTNFIQQPLPPGSNTGASTEQPGALGMGQRASTGITTFNQFWQYVMPLLGAYVADAHWGRFKTISYALGIDLVGHVILILSAIPPIIVNSSASAACLILAVLVIGFGTGGFKPNISCLIAEQLGDQRLIVKTLPKTGERVIVDPAITTERIYMWFYFFINVGALVGQITMVYAEQHVGFYLSFTLPTIMLALCPAVMYWGRNRYVHRPPDGSVLVPAFKTFFLAQRGRWSINPWATWRNMHDGTFWDSVKPSKFTAESRPKWMTFDDAWVDELRRGFAACAVFCWYPIFWLCYNQINNNLVSQAAVLQRHGVPNDILSNLNPFSLLIFIPLNNFIIYPALRKAGVRLTPIRKITAGFFVGAAAMIWAAVVQYYIYQKSVCGNRASGKMIDPDTGDTVKCPAVEINVWAQTGSYVLIALSEVFASITSLEYAYSKAPKNMRSMVQAVALFSVSFAAAIGQALVGLSADPLLVWNYGVVAILAVIAGTCFFLQFKDLDIIEDELNELPEGQMMKVASDEKIAHLDEKSTA